LDRTRDSVLKVYDTQIGTSWDVATTKFISGVHFSWGPNNSLTYLVYRPDLSGSPYPDISDLHQVDLNGENDRVIIPQVVDAGDFVWLSDEERIIIIRRELNNNALYMLNVNRGTNELLLKAEDIDLQHIAMLALSPDEKTILIYGLLEKNGQYEAPLVLYDIETKIIRDRLIPSEIIPSGGVKYPVAGIGDSTNFGWVGGQRWFLADVNTPGGECYNYALFFFDTQDSKNSFCIPSVKGIISDPVISPDLTKISYITVVGVGEYYVVVGNVTAELLEKLKSGEPSPAIEGGN
jgi:hypothetical protein